MPAALLCLAVYAATLALTFSLRSERARKLASRAIPFASLLGLAMVGAFYSPSERLLLSTLLLLGLVKCAAALRRPRGELRLFSKLGLALHFAAWPGVDLAPFRRRGVLEQSEEQQKQDARGLFRGVACLVLGIAMLAALAWFEPSLDASFAGWATIFALLCAVHLGVGEMLPWIVHAIGFDVAPMFLAPLASTSLSDFWSRRWNRAFVEMDRILFLRPLRRRLGARGALFAVFVLSGVFHEAAISYPAGAGWGGPLLYFVLHGLLVTLAEPRIKSAGAQRILTWAALLLPLPLLFHAPFREHLILPLLAILSRLIHLQSFNWYFDIALWLGCAVHFGILGASFQVPTRLGWKEDFASLSGFNRKIFWTYGGFIVLSIIALGTLAGLLHSEMMRGDRAAVAVSVWIGIFWSTRVAVDLFYFKPDDWPRGRLFEIGHTFLTFAFVCLAVLFGIVVPWHALWLQM